MDAQWAEAALFRPPRRTNLARQIADHLRRRIVTGDLAQGRRLPPLRKLARFHGVSLSTMEKAIHILASLGFVRITPSIGTFVTTPKDHAALLVYAWKEATPYELAVVRATVDERASPMLAAEVRSRQFPRRPRTLDDINLLVHERSLRRIGLPRAFLRADLEFHECLVRSLRDVEMGSGLYRQVGKALLPTMMGVADLLADDEELDRLHLEMAAAVLDGRVTDAARAARTVARREFRSLADVLGSNGALR